MAKKKLSALARLEERVADLEDKRKRALADYANLEKRIKREKKDYVLLANAQLLDKILPVLDELAICQRHLKDKGLEMVLNKFQQVLTSEEVVEVKAGGHDFDPETMDAVEIVAGAKNRVVGVVAKGYKIKDKLLRPAKVKVGSGSKKDKT